MALMRRRPVCVCLTDPAPHETETGGSHPYRGIQGRRTPSHLLLEVSIIALE